MAIAQREMALSALKRLLAPNQVVTNPSELITYEVDAAFDRGTPMAVVFPRTTDDVVHIVKWAAEHGIPLVARGAGTGLSGGAVAERGGVIVAFSRMNRVLELDEAGRSVVVEPGVVNLVLDELVKTKGLYYPPDPASGRTATIGGNVAENAGGPHCFKYGVTTNYVAGLEVVLADGRVVRLGGRALDYPEYDLAGAVTGGEGMLGLITRVEARLLRNTPAIKTMMASFDSVEEAGVAVSAVIARGLVPATMELMDRKIMRIIEDYAHAGLPVEAGAALIIEADGYRESVSPQIEEIAAILRDHAGCDLRIAQTAEERDLIWLARKSAAGAITRLTPAYYLLDGTVPRSKLAATLAEINRVCEAAALRVGYVFHAGDGNLHPYILIPDPDDADLVRRAHAAGRAVMELCVRQDGSITGEHGVGIEKRQYMTLMHSAAELRLMQDVKEVFDPANILNPGKVIPELGSWGAGVQGSGGAEAQGSADPQYLIPNTQYPTSATEAADALRACVAAGQSARIRGGGTKSGLLPPANSVLSTSGLAGIIKYAPEDLFVTVGAGTPLAELQVELSRDMMWAPLASPWPAATVGGIVATSFNAPLRMRYGAVRDLVLAATVAMPDGAVIRAGRPVVKNVAGYDLPKLFVGSHGTLGLITDVSLKLAPLPRARASIVVPIDNLAQGLALSGKLLPVCLVASALLLCRGCDLTGVSSPYVLVYTAEGMPEDVAAELAQVRAVVSSEGCADLTEVAGLSGSAVWATRLGAILPSETSLRAGVPPKDLPRLMVDLAPTLAGAAFIADFANGLLYVQGVANVAAVRRPARAAGGYAVILAGPGGGDPWGHTPDGLDLMRGIKAKWDPAGLCNPGAFIV
ncbi:MAG: FAD-binding protein [Chloroflexi bacterium]|nr:FAD-binding protein [Chloroflexota bacterium]